MKFVFALVTLLSLTQVACAQPNYRDAKPLQKDAKPGSATCPLYFTTEDLCANYDWIAKPTEDETGSFLLKFWSRADGRPADPQLTLKVVIWMPDMGHGSSPVTIAKKAVGEYLVDRVFFSMRGDWQIRFQLKNAQAVTEEQIANVTF
jgi:hypothetical protein